MLQNAAPSEDGWKWASRNLALLFYAEPLSYHCLPYECGGEEDNLLKMGIFLFLLASKCLCLYVFFLYNLKKLIYF